MLGNKTKNNQLKLVAEANSKRIMQKLKLGINSDMKTVLYSNCLCDSSGSSNP